MPRLPREARRMSRHSVFLSQALAGATIVAAITASGVLAGAAFADSATPSTGSDLCGEHGILSETLKQRYAEQLVAAGVDASGGLVEVYASQTGTWTILMTRPNGASCIVNAGDYWRQRAPELPGEPS